MPGSTAHASLGETKLGTPCMQMQHFIVHGGECWHKFRLVYGSTSQGQGHHDQLTWTVGPVPSRRGVMVKMLAIGPLHVT